MSRPIIETQLEKCQFADLSNFDPATNTFHIPKYSKPTYQVGAFYLVKVAADVVGNPTSVVATNWNRGSYPQFQYLKAYVAKTSGKMIYIDTIAYNIETETDIPAFWSGWLSIDSLTQLRQF